MKWSVVVLFICVCVRRGGRHVHAAVRACVHCYC